MSPEGPIPPEPVRKKYVRAVGPRLRVLLLAIFAMFALLGANSLYLSSITFLGWAKGLSYENYFYQFMFLAHLVLGLLFVLPVIVFGIIHIKNSHDRPNRRAVRVGYALFVISLVLLFTGIALMRVEGFQIKNPAVRSANYWAHVIAPLLAVWLYILHRLAGPRIKWKVGLSWAATVAVVVLGMVVLHSQDPRKWNQAGPAEGTNYFHPSLVRTTTGNFIPARTLMMDDYCMKCHEDAYKGWFHSSHHFSSFNNKPYLFSVRETRKVSLERDGNVKASRWCAGCHDLVPFLSGAFDDPNFDLEKHPTSQAGITCTACHAITHINSTRGNADYTIEEPIHYPFAFSSNNVLRFINEQLVKAKPEFHKKTFLKPLHQTAEFCSTCHKVSIPAELTKYKDFLRGQNSYDTYLLSGVSGHSARSFYYPEHAQENCNGCHMPIQASGDFGAKFFNNTNRLSIHNHLFPAANTGIAHMRGEPAIVKAHEDYLKGSVRVDIFGVKEDGRIDGALQAPIRPKIPTLKRGKKYLLETVIRTVRLGHPFTQGTTDSNEIWVDAQLASGSRVVGRSGGMGDLNSVDPWSHFLNVFMLDREGNRIDRRNPQDIFTPLYNHQIPPGAGQVAHYSFTVPEDLSEPLTVQVKLQYRKFDTTYMQYVFGKDYTNDLPIVTISSDRVTFPVEGAAGSLTLATNQVSPIVEWQRWNDYGIGLFLEGDKGSEKGELIQAAEAFAQVEKLGRPDGPLNLARVYFKEGRLEEAVSALQRAAKTEPPAPRWTIAWLNGLVNKQNGFLDKAITEFRSILEDRYPELDNRGFDFSKDYEVINELGQTLVERSKQERGEANKPQREAFLKLAAEQFERTLGLDSENLTAHWNLYLIQDQLRDSKAAEEHRRLHERYRPDDNARDRAIAIQRRKNPAADNAAQATVIYPLQRPGAPGLPAQPKQTAQIEAPVQR
ncbi:MAG: response regulator aspartate phosphatase rapC [Verrucomicrobiales bacterium]|nr:response regulator aspartate phosphatase rapC [Verrucomicrobiales bacterium]